VFNSRLLVAVAVFHCRRRRPSPVVVAYTRSGCQLPGAVVNPDVHADIEPDIALEVGPEARPTQPPHPSLIVDVPFGYPEDLGTSGTPDTVDVEDVLVLM